LPIMLEDTSFTVDAFKYGIISGCTAYFLTHFHYDHYGGLSKGFTEGIYCSEITKKFLLQNFGCCLSVHALPMNTFVNVQGCDVMLLDANHCPGSVMILFRLVLQNKVILHTGDFRAQSWMLESPNVLNHYIQSPRPSSSARITTLLLDTTYCCPTYGFPTQDTVISAAVKVTREFLLSDPDTLVVCGMYSIGKERFVLGLAEALGLAVWLPSKQKRLIEAAASGGCAICSDLLQRQAPTKAAADLVVADMGKLNAHTLRTELCPSTGSSDRRSLLAWRPTGWTHNSVPKKNTSSAAFSRLPCPKLIQDLADCLSVIHTSFGLTILGAAYSEHSSFVELRDFVTALQPLKVQQTVFGGAAKEAKQHINSWLSGIAQVAVVSPPALSIASFSSSITNNAAPTCRQYDLTVQSRFALFKHRSHRHSNAVKETKDNMQQC
uniref:DRMBL domain-containing protein n=1 Tax=Schistocephalus solidus TaxID=70667 RepID=A0A183T586_SCHSO